MPEDSLEHTYKKYFSREVVRANGLKIIFSQNYNYKTTKIKTSDI